LILGWIDNGDNKKIPDECNNAKKFESLMKILDLDIYFIISRLTEYLKHVY